MNYLHSYHAGNFADLMKHAALMAFLRLHRETGRALMVVDTHAGAGGYDLSNPEFARSQEAQNGIKHLLSRELAKPYALLGQYVQAKNKGAELDFYPGSPLMIVDHLGAGSDYLGCELNPSIFPLLQKTIMNRGRAFLDDGYAVALKTVRRELADEAVGRDLFLLLDPPFERGDDYQNCADTVLEALSLRPDLKVMIWVPLKDLETLDRFLRTLEDAPAPICVAEARLRPLTNPMKMNGCALLVVNPPAGFEPILTDIAEATVSTFGETGASFKHYTL